MEACITNNGQQEWKVHEAIITPHPLFCSIHFISIFIIKPWKGLRLYTILCFKPRLCNGKWSHIAHSILLYATIWHPIFWIDQLDRYMLKRVDSQYINSWIWKFHIVHCKSNLDRSSSLWCMVHCYSSITSIVVFNLCFYLSAFISFECQCFD